MENGYGGILDAKSAGCWFVLTSVENIDCCLNYFLWILKFDSDIKFLCVS